MANHVTKLSDEIYARGKQYRVDNNFDGSITAHLIEDQIDAISKLHLPVPEFFTELIGRIEYIAKGNALVGPQRLAVEEMLRDIILPHQQSNLSDK